MNLEEVLNNYGIKGKITNTTTGPLLDIIEFEPESGTKIKNIVTSTEDIRRELGVSSLRIEPAKTGNNILFQIPRNRADIIDFGLMLESPSFKEACNKYALPIILGTNIKGEPIISDLAKMPHLLVGGTTGSGKSVGLNTFILSLIKAKTPSEIKFVLIDPKKIEFSIYNNQKYMYCPVVTETTEAVKVLSYLAHEMDKRYELFAKNLCKNISQYNQKGEGSLPYIICVIDEFADLMAIDKNVEKDVMRLAQKARASGIHLILATQRPSVDVVTGVLKANFPTRLAYKVASSADSRTILDTQGAEDLIGRGDALYIASNGELTRIHGAYMEDDAIAEMLKPLRCNIKPLKLDIKEDKEISKNKEPQKISFLQKIIRFWSDLRVKDRKLILDALKSIVSFIIGIITEKNKRHK